jgi:predicted DNA-binding antitoxin AbrB/MazE fold protein
VRIIKARYRKHSGLFEPLEPVELLDEAVVDVTVPDAVADENFESIVVPDPTAEAIEAFHRSAGGWKDLLPEEFMAEVRRRREIRRQPVDL